MAVLLITATLYWPGLSGSYIQDDYPNIVDNSYIRIQAMDWHSWLQAVWASPSSDIHRPLSTLSFALDYVVDGLAPWPMKAVNLGIHLLNGLLLFLLLRRISILATSPNIGTPDSPTSRSQWLVLLVAGLWLLHPINLTAVLYVVQRMESLAQVFVLTGLLFYVDSRVRWHTGRGGAVWRLWLAVPLCTLVGLLAKETAVMLPAYALLLELTVFSRLTTDLRERQVIRWFFLVFLVIPAALGLVWLVPHYVVADSYAARPFTLVERMLTEPRVLLDYVGAILFPAPNAFSFYHDDYAFSTGLLHPWTTLPSILAIATMAIAGVVLRKSRPLVALGLLGFLVAHVLTASFIPLELMYEHRNYFASAMLLLAALDLLLPASLNQAPFHFPRVMLACALCLLCAFSLSLRAHVWSDPLQLALTEAALHPDSPRATYDLGRTYAVLSGYQVDSPATQKAIMALEHAASVPGADILPEVALITVAGRTGRRVDPVWWQEILRKLASRTPTVADLSALASLTDCQRTGRCPADDRQMLAIYLAAIARTPSGAALYSYAIFAHNRLHDTDLALRLTRAAAEAPPQDPQYLLNLVNYLIDLGRAHEAETELGLLERRVRFGRLDAQIASARARLANMARDPIGLPESPKSRHDAPTATPDRPESPDAHHP